MPERTIGIRGYVGELIVYQYLKNKFPESEGYKIIKEIIPLDFSQKGGGYLDLAVTQGDKIRKIYEVKTQDFIFGKDFYPNPALKYIWEKHPTKFKDSMDNHFIADKNIKAFLVVLVPPNDQACVNIGLENIKNIILFSDLNIDSFLNIQKIKLLFQQDLEKELKSIKNPRNGKRIIKSFLAKRTT